MGKLSEDMSVSQGGVWQLFFRISALFNVIVAAVLVFVPELFFKALGMDVAFVLNAVPWLHQFGVVVFVFGVGYWVISLDPPRHKDIIWMGCLGKVLVFIMALVDGFTFPWLLPFVMFVVTDLVIAAFYARYLWLCSRTH